MTRDEAKKELWYSIQFDNLNVVRFINKIYEDFQYKIDKVIESLEDRQNEFVDDEFYQNLIKDIKNIMPKDK